jgi:ABC-type glycerol-3-phosphate transport system permease component
VPPALLFIPLFAVMSTLRLIDTHQGLILAYLSFSVPFSTWLLMGYFRSVPLELEEAALVDGCSRLGSLIRVILPMSLPALAVVTFFSFTQSWNEFLYANVFVNSVEVRTITTGLSLFIVEDVFFWGPMMGASFLSTLPPLVMYLIFQRWVVKGLTLGAVKG